MMRVNPPNMLDYLSKQGSFPVYGVNDEERHQPNMPSTPYITLWRIRQDAKLVFEYFRQIEYAFPKKRIPNPPDHIWRLVAK